MNIGILPNVNFTRQKRVAKPVTSVCSRTTRLNSHKRRESDDKYAVAVVNIVSQLGCVSQDSDALVSQRGKQSRGHPSILTSVPCMGMMRDDEMLGHLSLENSCCCVLVPHTTKSSPCLNTDVSTALE